jgi:two-component system chemotaxis sensor kinase CheA
LLAAGDLLRAQLAHYSGQAGPPEMPTEAMCERIRACITGVATPTAAVPAAEPAAEPVAAPSPPPAPKQAARRTLEISFPAGDGLAPLLPDLIAQLKELGSFDDLTPAPTPAKKGKRTSKKAAAAAKHVWRLVTDAADDVVTLLFEFVMDSSTVKIETLETHAPPAEEPPVQVPAESPSVAAAPASSEPPDPGYGFFQPVGAEEAAKPPPAASPAAPPAPSAPKREPERAASGSSETSIRVSVEKVDQLINLVGELVITQAMLAQSAAKLDPLANEKLLAGMADLERNTRDLQEAVMSIRMMPIAFVFQRFPRLIRDLAAKLGKQVQLATFGEGTELDKGLIEKISDPLTHLVRNSIDHGIETTEERIAAGKPPVGTVTLRAAHQGGNIIIEVSDDGAGLNRERILGKARERGMAVSDSMSDSEVWGLIFEAGFSTAEVVTDVSGRGVGMDVVRRNIASLSGSVEIDSVAGVGTRMTVRLPLTLAIIDGMSVAVGSEVYILPIASIVESLQVAEGEVRSVAGKGLVIDVRGEYLPVVSLHELFLGGPALGARASGTTVIVEADGGKTALLIDELLGQHQVVVKSLAANYRKVHGISGATIMGDGRVALILDVATLTRNRRQSHAHTLQ